MRVTIRNSVAGVIGLVIVAVVGVVLWPTRAVGANVHDPPNREELMAIRSNGLAKALKSPEALWRFLIAPGTPYMDRWAAAAQGKDVLTPEYLPKLYGAMDELRRESGLHNWGMNQDRMLSIRLESAVAPLNELNPKRLVLGQAFELPVQRQPFPLTRDDADKAPWPWQVQQILGWVQAWSIPRGTDGRDPEPWLAAAMTMPVGTDDEAALFIEASGGITHSKNFEVMARWRAILNDPRKPRAAMAVANALAHQAIQLWPAGEARDIGQVLFLDGLKSPSRELRTQVAYALRSISETWDPRAHKTGKVVLATSVLAACEQATGTEDDEWTRLYCYAFTVCESVDNPPLKVDRRMDPQSPEVAKSLAAFGQWYRDNKEKLEALAAKEAPALQATRERLDNASTTAK